jgi:hypothetical protein
MRLTRSSCLGLVVLGIALCPARTLAQAGAGPAPAGKTSGTLTIGGGKPITLSHAVAFDAGATKLILITEQAVPREQVKSEMDLMRYNFEKKPSGMVLWLDSANKLTRASFMSAAAMTEATSEVDLALTGATAGTLAGTLKSKAAATKLKLDVSFSASTKP